MRLMMSALHHAAFGADPGINLRAAGLLAGLFRHRTQHAGYFDRAAT
jgi:hypothetical protein